MHDVQDDGEGAAGDHDELVIPAVVREMSGGCGWSVAEFADFYAPRARAELAELEDACRAGDTPSVVRLAHGAAGSSSSAGIAAMTVAYLHVEASARRGDTAATTRLLEEAHTRLDEALAALRALGKPLGEGT